MAGMLYVVLGLAVLVTGRQGSRDVADDIDRLSSTGDQSWGYVDVRPGAHMFYWIHFTTHPDGYINRPIVVWLQGGPGLSGSGFGNFQHMGPLDLYLEPRDTTWVQEATVIFIDNPVGAGYSYCDDDCYTTDGIQIAEDLMNVFLHIYRENPEFGAIPLYIFGQSYGGKMAALIAKRLIQGCDNGEIEVTLGGLAMGNSWISPVDITLSYADMVYWMGVVDENGRDHIAEKADIVRTLTNAGHYSSASDAWSDTLNAIGHFSHNVDIYNICNLNGDGFRERELSDQPRTRLWGVFDSAHLMNTVVKEYLDIPDDVEWGAQVGDAFGCQYNGDFFMQDVVAEVDYVLQNSDAQVVVYEGNLDIICSTVGAIKWVKRLTWDGMTCYHSATRNPIVRESDGQTEMFVKANEKFKFYWVMGAGHQVPMHAGETALRMLRRILTNQDQ